LQIGYLSIFNVKSIFPAPYHRDDLDQTLNWARTQDLVSGKTEIILTVTSPNNSSNLLCTIIVTVAAVDLP